MPSIVEGEREIDDLITFFTPHTGGLLEEGGGGGGGARQRRETK